MQFKVGTRFFFFFGRGGGGGYIAATWTLPLLKLFEMKLRTFPINARKISVKIVKVNSEEKTELPFKSRKEKKKTTKSTKENKERKKDKGKRNE